MKPEKLEKIAQLMGLTYNPNDNFGDMKERGIRVFNGANAQRVLVDSNWTDEAIFKKLGSALIEYGEIKRSLEIRRLINY